jgi:hypothetical protein
MKKELDSIKQEFKTLKTVLEVPKLRDNLKNYDLKNIKFADYLKSIDDLTFNLKDLMIKSNVVSIDKEFLAQQKRVGFLKNN